MPIYRKTEIYFSAIIVVTLLLFWPYFKWLAISWYSDPMDTFGYLAPIVSAWVLISKRKEIYSTAVSYNPWGWVLFISGIGLSILFRLNGQPLLACVALLFYIFGLCLITQGKERTRYLLFPIFILLFLYPWGNLLDSIIGFPLRRLSVFIAFFLYKTMGMEAAVSGTLLFTGRFLVDIAPACSGLTMMNVLLFIGTIGIFLYRGKVGYKIFILASIIPLAIILNTLRIALTGLIGHLWGGETALAFYHNLSGMFVFGLALLLLYGEANTLKRFEGHK